MWSTSASSLVLALAAFLAVAVSPVSVSAQSSTTPPPDWTVTLAGKVWVSSGWSNWNFKNEFGFAWDRRWRGVDTVVGELSADVVWKRVVWMLSVGGSTIDQGAFIAENRAPLNVPTGARGRFSLTHSPVDDGSLFYVSNDIGARLVDWRQPLFGAGPAPAVAAGHLDGFIGYQFWREEYVAFGAQGSLFFNGLVANQSGVPSNFRFVTNQYTRHSIRLGTRTQIPVLGSLSLKALAVVSPYTHTDYADTHHLMVPNVLQPGRSSTNGGFGVQAEAGLNYVMWARISAEAGFRYWRFHSIGGEVLSTLPDGGVLRENLREMTTERYGPYVGLSWRF